MIQIFCFNVVRDFSATWLLFCILILQTTNLVHQIIDTQLSVNMGNPDCSYRTEKLRRLTDSWIQYLIFVILSYLDFFLFFFNLDPQFHMGGKKV